MSKVCCCNFDTEHERFKERLCFSVMLIVLNVNHNTRSWSSVVPALGPNVRVQYSNHLLGLIHKLISACFWSRKWCKGKSSLWVNPALHPSVNWVFHLNLSLSRMWALPATLLLLHIAHLCCTQCTKPDIKSGTLDLATLNLTCVDVSSQSISRIQGKPSEHLKELDLSHNQLQELPQEFLDNILNLEKLYLNDNKLKQFPSKFGKLVELRLQGNELTGTSLPTNTFPETLKSISVDCHCELVNATISHCTGCTVECRKPSETGLSNATEYYIQQCGAQKSGINISIPIVVSILALVLVAGVAYFLIRRKKKGTTFGQDKRASNVSNVTQGQPRYHTHSGPQDLDRGMGHDANYENVFIDQAQEARGGPGDHQSQRQPKSRWVTGDMVKGHDPVCPFRGTEGVSWQNVHHIWGAFGGGATGWTLALHAEGPQFDLGISCEKGSQITGLVETSLCWELGELLPVAVGHIGQ